MGRRALFLILLMFGQSVLASAPMACGDVLESPPCHGETLYMLDVDTLCEMRCATAGPGMVAFPAVLASIRICNAPEAAQVPAFELPPIEEIFHPPIPL